MALDSKNLVTQKENLFHLHEKIRKMDAGVKDEDTSTTSRGPSQKHGWDSNLVALSNAVGKAQSGVSRSRLFYSFFTFPNFDCGRIWDTIAISVSSLNHGL